MIFNSTTIPCVFVSWHSFEGRMSTVSFIHVSLGSLILHYAMSYEPFLLYLFSCWKYPGFLDATGSSFKLAPISFWHDPIIAWALPCFVAQNDVFGPSYIRQHRSRISHLFKEPIPFSCKMAFSNQGLGNRCARGHQASLLPGPVNGHS